MIEMNFLAVVLCFSYSARFVHAGGIAKETKKGTPVKEIDEVTASISKLSNDDRRLIVGGTPTIRNRYPYYAFLGHCGGTLIHPQVVLTAAHCYDNENLEVYVGVDNLSDIYGDEGGSDANIYRRTVTNFVPHPEYDINNDVANDIMLLKLNDPIPPKASGGIQPVKLNRNIEIPAIGDDLMVIGFGATSEKGSSYPSKILQISVPRVSINSCNETLHDLYFQHRKSHYLVDETMICAGGELNKDSCFGDSGGPLLKVNNEDTSSSDIQVGIVSQGEGCARPDHSGIYTSISAFVDWIDEQVCLLTDGEPSACPTTLQPSSCSSDKDMLFELDLNLGNNAMKTLWSLQDKNGNTHFYGTGHEDGSTKNIKKCIKKDECHIFTITHERTDGSYTIFLDGIEQATGPTTQYPVSNVIPIGSECPTVSSCNSNNEVLFSMILKSVPYLASALHWTLRNNGSNGQQVDDKLTSHLVAEGDGDAIVDLYGLYDCIPDNSCFMLELIDRNYWKDYVGEFVFDLRLNKDIMYSYFGRNPELQKRDLPPPISNEFENKTEYYTTHGFCLQNYVQNEKSCTQNFSYKCKQNSDCCSNVCDTRFNTITQCKAKTATSSRSKRLCSRGTRGGSRNTGCSGKNGKN